MATEITTTNNVLVTETAQNVVEVKVPGPQGPAAPAYGLGDLTDVDTSAKVANSVLYYDPSSGMWLGNDINTVTTLTDGGNF